MKEEPKKNSDDPSVIEEAHCLNHQSCTGNVRCEFVSRSRQRGRLHSIVTSLTSTRSQPSEESREKQEEGDNLHQEMDNTAVSSKCKTSRKMSPNKVTSNATKEFFNFVLNKRKTKTGKHQPGWVNEVVEQTTEMSSANASVSRNAAASGHLKSKVSQTQEPLLLNLDSQINTAQPPLTTSGLPSVVSLPSGNQQALLFLVGAPGMPVTGDLTGVGSLGSSVPFGNAVFLAQPLALNLIPADASSTSGVIEKAMELANVGTNSMGTASQQSSQCTSESQSEFSSQTLQGAMQSFSSQNSLLGDSSFNPVPQVSQDIVLGQSTSGESIAIDNISQSVTVQTTQVAQTQSRILPSLLEVVNAEVSGSGSEVASRPKMIYKRRGASYREVMTQTGNEPEVIILNEVREHFTEHLTGNTPNGEGQSSTAKKPGSEKVRRFPCDICDKKFFSNHDLKRHRAIHQDSRPFVCEVCKKTFRTHSELKLHLAIHNEGTPYKCEFCGKEFRTKGCIKSHIKYHIGDKRHKCTECGRAFVKSADLKRHMAGHRNEKKFVCDDCGSAFTRRDNLKAHRLLHSRESVVTCDLCNKEFINAVYLKRHMHIHKQAKKKPYECQWCPKTYEQLEGLRRHIRQHVGDEKFVCKHCAKKFITSIQLKRHLWLSHEQDSPYRRSIL